MIPTLQEIANALGVSKATVSFALRNSPKIPLETRQKVQEAATRMGYKPNALVGVFMSHLRASRPVAYQATLAWATSHSSEEGWTTNRAAARYYEGAKIRCEERGYRLEIFWTRQPGMTRRRQKEIFDARGIRGVLVNSLPASMGHISLDFSHLAALTCGYSVVRPNIDRVACDIYRTVLMLLRKARFFGYKRIGVLYPQFLDQRMDYLITAAVHTFALHLPRNREVISLIFDGKIDSSSAIKQWLDRERPDFVMGQSAHYAGLIRETGRKIPEDIGFALLERAPDAEDYAGMNQNHELTGAYAADLVIQKIQMNEFGLPTHPRITLVQADWIDGPTVRHIAPLRGKSST